MYITRPGVNTVSKKLDVRDSMTFHEYTIAYLKMIRDPRAQLSSLSNILLEHLQQVVEDVEVRGWPSARTWTQSTFDDIERGDYTWDDTHTIQFHRLRSAYSASKAPLAGIEKFDKRDLPCRDYNSFTGCQYPKSHPGRNVNFAHICSLCFNHVGEEVRHPAVGCPRAQRHTSAVNMPPPRSQNFQQYGAPPQQAKNDNRASQYRPRRLAGSDQYV